MANLQSECLSVKNIMAFSFFSCLFLGPGIWKWAEIVLLSALVLTALLLSTFLVLTALLLSAFT